LDSPTNYFFAASPMKKIYALLLLAALQVAAVAIGTGLHKLINPTQHGGISRNEIAYRLTTTFATILTLFVYFGFIRPRWMAAPVVPQSNKFPKIGIVSALIFGAIFLVFVLAENRDRLIWARVSLPFILFAATAAVYPAVLEEILYRDMLLRWTLPRLGLTWALLIQGLLFAGTHSFVFRDQYLQHFISWGISGIFLAMVWAFTKNLYPPILLHFFHNFLIYIFNGFSSMQIHYLGLISGEPDAKQFYFSKAYQVSAIIILFILYQRNLQGQKRAAPCEQPRP
jgi:membrane protease YdiL (CAAX protease family)